MDRIERVGIGAAVAGLAALTAAFVVAAVAPNAQTEMSLATDAGLAVGDDKPS